MYFLVISFQEFLNFGEYIRLDQDVLKTKTNHVFKTSSSRRMFVGYYYNYYCQHCIRCCGGDASKSPSDGNFFWLLLV